MGFMRGGGWDEGCWGGNKKGEMEEHGSVDACSRSGGNDHRRKDDVVIANFWCVRWRIGIAGTFL